jgi:hypothetical protein
MIKGIASTWSTRFWLWFARECVFGQKPTRKPHRLILTADSMTLHLQSIQRMHPHSSFAFLPWSKALLVPGRQDSGFGFFVNSFRSSFAHPKTVWHFGCRLQYTAYISGMLPSHLSCSLHDQSAWLVHTFNDPGFDFLYWYWKWLFRFPTNCMILSNAYSTS